MRNEEWVKRMDAERKVLDDYIKEIRRFMRSNAYFALPDTDRTLLHAKFNIMLTYESLLNQRRRRMTFVILNGTRP